MFWNSKLKLRKQISLWRPSSLCHVNVNNHDQCVVEEQRETNVDVTKLHNQTSLCRWQSVFHLRILFSAEKKKKKTSEHLSCRAPITLKLSCDVTTVINAVVGPHGSGTKLSDPAVWVGCLWWLKAGPHAVMDRWPRSGPSAQLKI